MIARRLTWFVGLALLYLWFVVEATRDEALAALGCAAVVSFVLSRVAAQAGRPASAPVAGWRAIVLRVPFAAVRESVDALGPVLWRAIVRGERSPGRWIALRYESDEDGARDGYGRRTLVVFGSGLTPNACPLGIDDGSERFYLHQLVRRRESAANDPRYPL